MTCKEIITYLESQFPGDLACDWDNVGLLAGRSDKEVKTVYIALDVTEYSIAEAIRHSCDMLITHHPLIFSPIKQINDQSFTGRRLLQLISQDISYFAAHTNYDIAPGCMADLVAGRLGLKQTSPLQVTGLTGGVPVGIGKTGRLKKPVSLKELCQTIKQAFKLPFINLYTEDEQMTVERIAVCPGSGRHMEEHVCASGAQVFITGDIGHHDGLDAVASGYSVIDAGHYGLEHIFIADVAARLQKKFTGLDVIEEPIRFPAKIY